MTLGIVPSRRAKDAAGLRLGGALWVAGGVCCAGLLLVVFVGEGLLIESLGLSLLFLAGAVVALLVGGSLLTRPTATVERWSAVAGVGWLLAFGSLIVSGLSDPDPDPRKSLLLILAFGVAGALVTRWSGRAERPG